MNVFGNHFQIGGVQIPRAATTVTGERCGVSVPILRRITETGGLTPPRSPDTSLELLLCIRISACLIFCLATVCSANDVVPFQFAKEIQTEPRTQEELVIVPLDSDVYAATKDRFPDLRVFDSTGQAVPYVLHKATETTPQTIRSTWPARGVSLKPLDGGDLEIRVRLDEKDLQPSGFRVVTPLKNFEQRVRVFGADAEANKPLVPEAVIFDYSQYMDVRQSEVRLPKSTDREFRIVIDGLTSDQESQLLNLTRTLRGNKEEERSERITIERRPFRIDRIEFWSEQTQRNIQKETSASYPVPKIEVHEDKDKHQTVIEVHTRREPLNELRLQTSSRNFSRNAVVQVPETKGVKTDWREIGQATVSQFQFRDLEQEHRAITFAEVRHEKFRILIDNRDSAPLEITGVEANGSIYQAAFLAAPTASYRLTYGADVTDPPQYDTAALTAALGRGLDSFSAKLGPETPAATAGQPAPLNVRGVLNNPMVLGTIVCVLVAILGWGLYHASRRIEQMPKDEP